MQLSDKSVQKFKQVFKEEYGKEYTDIEAREAAENLVGFFDLLVKIDQRNKKKTSGPIPVGHACNFRPQSLLNTLKR